MVDVSSVTAALYIKRNLSDTTYLAEKADASFVKTSGTSGILTVGLITTDLNFNGTAYMILKLSFTATNLDKSNFRLHVTESVE